MNAPKELLYSEEHLWVQVEGKEARIGLTDFAQDEFGEIVFVELPKVDASIEANQSFGSVESVKTVSELYVPISGKVIQVNERLQSSPKLINESPYEQGWLMTIQLTDESQLKQLWSAEQYIETYGDIE